jgi:hypothetical protein
MAGAWRYWDNDIHEWSYIDPDYLENFECKSPTSLTNDIDYEKLESIKKEPKLPNLTIYDLVKEGFKEIPQSEPPFRTPLLKGTKSAPQQNIKNQKISKSAEGVRITKPAECKTAELALRLPKFKDEDRDSFPANGFYRQLKNIATVWTPRTENDERNEKEARIAKHNLTENFEPIVYHNPNPISHPKSHHAKKGYQMKPIENNSSIRMPSQLTSRNCAFIIKVPPIAEKPFNLERNKQEIENIERTEMLKVKIKNLSDLTRERGDERSGRRNQSPLQYRRAQKPVEPIYRLDSIEYQTLVEKTPIEPMMCRKILPSFDFGQKEIVSNINIDFEAALASRRDAKKTYRKNVGFNLKTWESNLRDYGQREIREAKTLREKRISYQEKCEAMALHDDILYDSDFESKFFERTLPPPPSPTVRSFASQPYIDK